VATAAERRAPWLYFALGQAGWYACVLSAAKNIAWLGESVALVLVIAHLLRVERPRQELKLLASVVVIGWVWESALLDLGLLAYPTSSSLHGLAPLWLPALWALFAAQINTTYSWLKRRFHVAVLIGAIAGPLSFRAGAALGALRFANPWPAAIALAAGWAVLLPLTTVLARRWDGVCRGSAGGS
jgi:hypothetical protein